MPTFLHWACVFGHLRVATMLVEHGADVHGNDVSIYFSPRIA